LLKFSPVYHKEQASEAVMCEFLLSAAWPAGRRPGIILSVDTGLTESAAPVKRRVPVQVALVAVVRHAVTVQFLVAGY